MASQNDIKKLLEQCRADVNREISLEYLTLFNNPETLEASFNGRMPAATESFELLAPEGQDGNFLLHQFAQTQRRMPTNQLPALYEMVKMQAKSKADPVHRTEAIELLLVQNEASDYNKLLERQKTYQRFNGAVPETNIQALMSHTQTALANHPYTAGHAARVMYLGMAFLDWAIMNIQGFPITRAQLIDARDAYITHDIGKNALREDVLDSPRGLTDDEWGKMRNHPIVSANIIRPVGAFAEEVKIVQDHHERWDGKGYPKGKSGEQIHPLARVCAIADSMDAMTSGRPYKTFNPTDREATAEIVKCAGTMYDPYLAHLFGRFMAEHDYDVERILDENSRKWLDLDSYHMIIPTLGRNSLMPPRTVQ